MVDGFLGNRRDRTYKKLVEKIINSYQKMLCYMFVKLDFLCSHLNFEENHGDILRSIVRDFTRILSQWKDDIKAA